MPTQVSTSPLEIRKKMKTLRKVSDPCMAPKWVLVHPSWDWTMSCTGERMSMKM